jgi:hypothetical protein
MYKKFCFQKQNISKKIYYGMMIFEKQMICLLIKTKDLFINKNKSFGKLKLLNS